MTGKRGTEIIEEGQRRRDNKEVLQKGTEKGGRGETQSVKCGSHLGFVYKRRVTCQGGRKGSYGDHSNCVNQKKEEKRYFRLNRQGLGMVVICTPSEGREWGSRGTHT